MIIVFVSFFLLFPALAIYLCYRFPAVNKLGTVILCYLVGITIGNLGILPQGFDMVQKNLAEVSVVLAIPLLLYSMDIRKWSRLAGRTILSFFLATVSIIIIALAGFFIIKGGRPDAWKHKRNEHRVRYRMRSESMTPHIAAHELEHIVLEQEARLINRNRFFVTAAKTGEYAVHAIADNITKLRRQGYSEDRISEIMLKLIQGLTGQLFNLPLDMLVERNLCNIYPDLRHSQFASPHQMNTEGLLASK